MKTITKNFEMIDLSVSDKMSQQIDIPLVSIITPTLNSERYIRDNVKSVLSQTYSNIEHIIIDGGSTDKTINIVQEMDPKGIIISEPDEGISDAFNKGIKLSKGDIIAILNSDDYYANGAVIERVVNIFSNKPEVMITYGMVQAIAPETNEILVVYGEPFSIKKMEMEIITPHPSIFARREVYERVGHFSLEYKICMDHDYFLRATKIYEPYFLDEIMTVMRLGGISTKNIYRAHIEAYRIIRSNGIKIISALANLLYRFTMTTVSLTLQKVGLTRLLLFYRKRKGKL